jgi:hypothetical protein
LVRWDQLHVDCPGDELEIEVFAFSFALVSITHSEMSQEKFVKLVERPTGKPHGMFGCATAFLPA